MTPPSASVAVLEDHEELAELSLDALEPLPPAEDVLESVAQAKVAPQRKRLGEILTEAGIVREQHIEDALAHQRVHGGRLGSVLITLGHLSEEALESNLGKQLGIEVCTVESIDPPPEVLAALPEAMMRKHQAIPLRRERGQLVIGMVDPSSSFAREELRFMTRGAPYAVNLITEATFERFMGTRFASAALADDEIGLDFEVEAPIWEDQLSHFGAGERPDDQENASRWEVLHAVDYLIENSVKRRASDIHIEPYESFSRVRYRVDGALFTALTPPKRLHNAIVGRIKVLSGLDIAERRKPQDGQMKKEVAGEGVDFRVSTLPTVHGEKCVIRLLKKEAHLADLGKLGLTREQFQSVERVAKLPKGLALVTGPTGSGKTTTLHAILNLINDPDINIVTLEDPVESAIPGINHVGIKDKGGVSFASGLRSILRQDPDVVFVGEMRDAEVANIAVKASLTGHLVLSTLHTNGVLETYGRLLDMGIDTWLLAGSLELIVGQRLMRRLCSKCAKPRKPSADEIHQWGLTEQQIETAACRGPVGCKACLKTGFKGRVAIYEIMRTTEELRQLLRTGAGEQAIKDSESAAKMITLQQAGVAKALAGESTFDEVFRVVGD